MKKFIVFIILLFGFLQPVFANSFTRVINYIFSTPEEKFFRAEHEIYLKSLENLNNGAEAFWNLDSSLYPSAEKTINHIKENNITSFEDLMNRDYKTVLDILAEFQKDKNNMKKNKELYDTIIYNFIDIYKDGMFINDLYKQVYNEYKKNLCKEAEFITIKLYGNKYTPIYKCDDTTGKCTYLGSGYRADVINSWQELKEKTKDDKNLKIYQIQMAFKNNIDKFEEIANQIKNYSIQYEKKKWNNFYKAYGNIKKCSYMLSDVLVGADTPQTGCYYDTYTSLEVIQVIPGGVIVKDGFSAWESKRAFIMTNKSYVDGEQFRGRFLYKGIYKYTNVLGANMTVWKFQELPLPKEEFFFIDK